MHVVTSALALAATTALGVEFSRPASCSYGRPSLLGLPSLRPLQVRVVLHLGDALELCLSSRPQEQAYDVIDTSNVSGPPNGVNVPILRGGGRGAQTNVLLHGVAWEGRAASAALACSLKPLGL